MKKIQRLAALGAMAALTVSLAACGNSEEPAASTSSSMAPMTTTMAPTTTEEAGGDGVTTAADVYGPACSQVPTTGEGSVDGMVDDPVATAASNNPLLTKLVAAVTAANLGDTLNGQEAITVFAPADPAFDALGPQLDTVLADVPLLTDILSYHVVPMRMDADGLVAAKTVETLQGGSLTIAGSGENFTVNGANVLCGNIPTANATVFVIDTVMMPTG